ncbi:MAG: hypothetical protein FJ028_07570 [Chloroflexi bacterium]|nr:hypothetical protein [Chloroflexota bacterium]
MRAKALVPAALAIVVLAGLSLYAVRSETPPPVALPPTARPTATAPPTPTATATDMLIPVPDADFELGHTGQFSGSSDLIHVLAVASPEGLSPRELKRQRLGESSAETLEDSAFAGRPALKVTDGQNAAFLFANAGDMWQVGRRRNAGNSSFADREAMMLSFRFLSAGEAQAARAAATPSPAPRSAAQVADVLADGFAKRDVTILARVIRPCLYEGAYQAGPSSTVAEKYLEKLRQRFAQGLTVDVRARPIAGDPGTTMKVRSTWREPGQPVREADLSVTVHRGTTYWDGTITCVIAPRPP